MFHLDKRQGFIATLPVNDNKDESGGTPPLSSFSQEALRKTDGLPNFPFDLIREAKTASPAPAEEAAPPPAAL